MIATQAQVDAAAGEAQTALRKMADELHRLAKAADRMAELYRPGLDVWDLSEQAAEIAGIDLWDYVIERDSHLAVDTDKMERAILACNDDHNARQWERETGLCIQCNGDGSVDHFGQRLPCHVCNGSGKATDA